MRFRIAIATLLLCCTCAASVFAPTLLGGAVSATTTETAIAYRQSSVQPSDDIFAADNSQGSPLVAGSPLFAIREVDSGLADRFGRLVMQSSDGRIQPVDTYSSEILRKIYHRDQFRGMDGNQVLTGLLGDPRGWSSVPIIYIAVPEVAEFVGAEGEYTIFNSLFDADGNYILTDIITRIYRIQPDKRTKTDKEYLKLDEKVNILYQLFNGGMMPVYPSKEGSRWLSPADASQLERVLQTTQDSEISQPGQDNYTADSSEASSQPLDRLDSLFVARVLPWYAESMVTGDHAEAEEALSMLEKYQTAKLSATDFNRKKIAAEIFYNKSEIFRRAFRLYLILGFILMTVALSSSWRNNPAVLKNEIRRSGTLQSSKAPSIRKRSSAVILLLTIFIAAIFVAHTFGIGLRWYISGRGPWANTYETMVYVGWIIVLSGLIFARRSPLALGLAALLGGVVLFVSNLSWLDPQITPLVPVLKSYWLMIHVSVITAGYGFFGISAMCGLASLVAILVGKSGESRKSLPELRKINELSLNIGLVLLTLGIFFGAIWANESWGRYWGWDPKETWALITMVVYAMITHSHFISKLNNDYALAAMSLGAISTVLMTFFGVNYYLSGLHSYGGSGEIAFIPVVFAVFAIVAVIVAAGVKYSKHRRTPESA